MGIKDISDIMETKDLRKVKENLSQLRSDYRSLDPSQDEVNDVISGLTSNYAEKVKAARVYVLAVKMCKEGIDHFPEEFSHREKHFIDTVYSHANLRALEYILLS